MNIIKKSLDKNFIREWKERGINPIILSILNRRGYTEEEGLIDFLFPLFENIISPFIFKDMERAYRRLQESIARGEKIIIYGDKDVDGVTSISILTDFLTRAGASVEWDLPVGSEQYGLSADKVESWKERYNLCITVDCGITNFSEIETLKSYNIDTIIIDHHSPLDRLPPAHSIINPKCEKLITDDDMAACALSFLFVLGFTFYKHTFFNKKLSITYYNEKGKLETQVYRNLLSIESYESESLHALNFKSEYPFFLNSTELKQEDKKLLGSRSIHILNFKNLPLEKLFNRPDYLAKQALFSYIYQQISRLDYLKSRYLPYVMFGLIADIMPLKSTNRILAFNGLKQFNKGLGSNLKALCQRLKIDSEMTGSIDIAWKICPLLNAPGRMGDARCTVNFLLDEENPQEYIETIVKFNEERKKRGDEAYSYFIDRIESNKEEYNRELNFFYSDKIFRGVTGIIASKLSDDSNCPTIVAACDGDYYIGSIRGKGGYHFVDFLDRASEILLEYGGHEQAAGFRLYKDDIPRFKEFLRGNSHLFQQGIEEEVLNIDAEIPLSYLNYKLFSIIRSLEPFGKLNENPVLFTSSIGISSFELIGREKNHVKLYLNTRPEQLVAMFWGKAEWFQSYFDPLCPYNIIYTMELNNYNNRVFPQLQLIELIKSKDAEELINS